MTYTIKEKDGKFCLYNTNSKKMLSKKYDNPVSAKAAVQRLNKSRKGVAKYHGCCRSHGCGKKNRKAAQKLPPKKDIKKKKKKRVALTQLSTKTGTQPLKSKMTKGQQRMKDTVSSLSRRAKKMDKDKTYNKMSF
jgi:hypothetical protein